jgi:hypothetical protein
MPQTPHKDKLIAALTNPKCGPSDIDILKQCLTRYEAWIAAVAKVDSTGKQRVVDLTKLLNSYKDDVEVELISKSQSPFLIRQKGQLKLDNSIIEEFLIQLADRRVLDGLPTVALEVGPQTAFMSLAFTPTTLASLDGKPPVELKEKDADFALGKKIHFKFSPDKGFATAKTTAGSLVLAVLAAECKINLDKTMFQEAAGTAARLKQGCPMSRYYLLVEYLDMEPEDCRLTAIDNVFLLRHAKRLPFEKRTKYAEIKAQHAAKPIDAEILWKFCQELQAFVTAVWYDPAEALERGSFI